MPSLLNSLMGNDKNKSMSNQAIANTMLAGSKAGAAAYLAATLECATPELRTLYSSHMNQLVTGHGALTALAINKGWYRPYDMPELQLSETFKQSDEIMKVPAEV